MTTSRAIARSAVCALCVWAASAANGCVPKREAGGAAEKASRAHDNSREQFSPAEPLPEGAVSGSDDDHDHIRDDVATFIDHEYDKSELKRLAARQYARSVEHQLVYAERGDRERALAAADESGEAIACLYAHFEIADADAVWREVHARTVDTEERLAAFFQMQKLAGGAYFAGAPDPAQACAFDSSGLTP